MMTLSRHLVALIVAATSLGAASGNAQSVPDNLIRAELLPGWTTDSGAQMAALRLTLAPGWKTYWRAPGAAGIPPQFDWSASGNLAGVAYHWPRPQVFDANGMRIIAYKNELVLPIEFLPAKPGMVTVAGTIDLGVCDEICVPITVKVAGTLGDGAKVNPALRTALAAAPDTGKAAGIATPQCSAMPIKDGMRLTTDIGLPGAAQGDFAVVEVADSSVWVSNVETKAASDHLVDVSDLVPSAAQPFALDRSAVKITLFTIGGRVIELQGCKG